jgi:hypothetical protein
MAAVPQNVDYYLQRLSGFTKNTIRVQPVSKTSYNSGETTIIRLPTNCIIDLHTLNLRFDGRMSCGAAGTNGAELVWPRHSASLMRRVDVTIGGVQVGLGSLGDYGGAFNLLAANTVGPSKLGELSKLEQISNASGFLVGNPLSSMPSGAQTGTAGSLWNGVSYRPEATLGASYKPNATTLQTQWVRHQCSTWLGLLGGQMMRFLDTNLLPDVEIRITWQNGAVIAQQLKYSGSAGAATVTGTPATGLGFNVSNIYAMFETVWPTVMPIKSLSSIAFAHNDLLSSFQERRGVPLFC